MSFLVVLRKMRERWFGSPRRGRRRGPAPQARRQNLARKLAVEELEDRTVMSVLPPPLVTSQAIISGINPNQPFDATHPVANTPSIAVDPSNPQDLVAVYTAHDAAGNAVIDAAISSDGGRDWNAFGTISALVPDPTAPGTFFSQATDASVAFDRAVSVDSSNNLVNAESFYVVYSVHRPDNAAGAIMLAKFDDHTGFPTASPLTPGLNVNRFDPGSRNQGILYEWASTTPGTSDPALNPVVIADANLPPVIDPATGNINPGAPGAVSFRDPQTGATQADRLIVPLIDSKPTDANYGKPILDPETGTQVYQGEIYVAWNTNSTAPTAPFGVGNFNPNNIQLVSSSDGGQTFTAARFADTGGLASDPNTANFGGSSNPMRAAAPRLVVSQGTSSDRTATGVAGGQLAIVWDNFGQNDINSNQVKDGGTGYQTTDNNPANQLGNAQLQDDIGGARNIIDADPPPSGSFDVTHPTLYTMPVNIQNPNFTTATSLDVTVNLVHPDVSQLRIRLLPEAKLAQAQDLTIKPNNGSTGAGNLFVSSKVTSSVVEYDGTDGHLVAVFVAPFSGGLTAPDGLAFGPNGDLFVASTQTAQVLEYNGNTGAFVKAFVSGDPLLADPTGLTFDASGNLYVTDGQNNDVLVYNAAGTDIGFAATAGQGGLQSPEGDTFGPDGDLYVTSSANGDVMRYRVTIVGAAVMSLSDPAPGQAGAVYATGMSSPSKLTFGPDADLYVSSSGSDQVKRFHGPITDSATTPGSTATPTPGTFLDNFVSSANGLSTPKGLAFKPDATGKPVIGGDLFVVSAGTTEVLRVSTAPGTADPAPPNTGATFLPSSANGGLNGPKFMISRPDSNFDYLITSFNNNEVTQFAANTGTALPVFIGPGSGGNLSGPTGITEDSSGNIFVASSKNNQILEYNSKGSFQGAFVTPSSVSSLTNPQGIAMLGGVLYIACFDTTSAQFEIVRFDPNAKQQETVLVAGGMLNKPEGITFDGNQNLLVVNNGTNQVLRYDSTTGAFISTVADPGTSPIQNPQDVFYNRNDDTLYVTSQGANPRVLRYRSTGNVYLESIVPLADNQANNGGLKTPTAVSLDPVDGTILVADASNNSVLRYTGTPALDEPSAGNAGSTFVFSGGGATSIVLVNNHLNADGSANTDVGLTNGGANLGIWTGPSFPTEFVPVGLTFDQEAARMISDLSNTAPYSQHFRPEGTGYGDNGLNKVGLNFVVGQGVNVLDSNWTLEITDFRANDSNGIDPSQFLDSWSINLTSGQDLVNTDRTVTGSAAVPGNASSDGSTIVDPLTGATVSSFAHTSFASPNRAVGPTPVIAQDNTLGSFSPYQGRLYVAWTGLSGTHTTVFLSTSDDGGQTWLAHPVEVEPSGTLPALRDSFDPSIAVDQSTGTLVVSYYSARDDAADDAGPAARSVLDVVTSTDGGWRLDPTAFDPVTKLVGGIVPDFSAPTALNNKLTATDAITQQQNIFLESIPENPTGDPLFNFGDRQGLAVSDGLIYAAWAGNLNGGGMSIYSSLHTLSDGDTAGGAAIADGPRVISSTEGPVQSLNATTDDGRTIAFNNTYAGDGTQMVNGFLVTFDRPVDPSTFGTDQVQVFYHDTNGNPATPVTVNGVMPLDGYTTRFGPAKVGGVSGGLPLLATTFLVTFQATGGVGTYTYAIGPMVSDRIRSRKPSVGAGTPLPAGDYSTPTDTTGTGTLPEPVPPQDTGGDGDKRDIATSTITVSGVPNSQRITDVQVTIQLQHTFASDLVITLTAPDGTTVLLDNKEGGASQIGASTPVGPVYQTFTLADPPVGIKPISQAGGDTPAFSGGPYIPETPFAALKGKVADGRWKLTLDDTQAGNTGSLGNWSLNISTGPAQVTQLLGNTMDQNGNAITGESSSATATGDVYSIPQPLSTGQNNGPIFHTPFSNTSLPLIVPGPHVVSTFVPGLDANGNLLNPPSADNVVVNQAVHFIDVTFDRNMQPAGTDANGNLFLNLGTASNPTVSTLMGPTGVISLYDPATGNPLPGVEFVADTNPQYPRLINGQLSTAADPDTSHPRTWRLVLPDQPGSAAGTGLALSGSYSLTITPQVDASGTPLITSQSGFGIDTNQNAGLDLLRGVASNPNQAKLTVVSHSTGMVNVPLPGGKTTDILLNFGPENFIIQKATVQLNIQYNNDPDLEAQLIAPDGTTVQLFKNVGFNGSRQNFTNTVFDDQGFTGPGGTFTTVPIQEGSAPFNQDPSYQPQTPLSVLSDPASPKSSQGTWILRITNDNPNGGDPNGKLVSWQLNLSEAVPGTGLAEKFADQVPVTFRVFTQDPTQAQSHTQWTAVGPAGITTAVTPATINPSNSAEITHSYSGSAAVGQPAVTLSPGTTQLIPLNFGPENFPIQQAVVTLNIQDPHDSGLEGSLIAPDGTVVHLFTNVGGNGADFANTIFSDPNRGIPAESGRTAISLASAPFNSNLQGRFISQDPLDLLLNKSSSGIWQLQLKNDSGTDTGTLTSWSLTLTEPTPSNSGAVTALAVDPSDPSGNTVYIGGASGGVWKTTDFLTTSKLGPTWLPLTDFGPTTALNVGSIAIFPRNNDPRQSIIFAATGDGNTMTPGVGFLRSMDGGATWALLDSTVNTDASGNLLAINDGGRDHFFVGSTTSFRIAVDPTARNVPGPFNVIVYAALSGPHGGLWRSLDAGNSWSLMTQTNGQSPGTNVTDVVLAPGGIDPTTGQITTVYAAYQGVGVFKSTNQGNKLTLMAGNTGETLIRDGDTTPASTVGLQNAGVSPNGALGRIVLSTPALAHEILTASGAPDAPAIETDLRNNLYANWLYAAVVNTDGTLNGLFVTKDQGANWTQILLPVFRFGPNQLTFTTNNETGFPYNPGGPTNPTAPLNLPNGNTDISLTIDPTDPNVVYLGGLNNVGIINNEPPLGGLVRIDTTGLHDPYSFTGFDPNNADGGATETNTVGGVVRKGNGGTFQVYLRGTNSSGQPTLSLPAQNTPFLNLLVDPNQPFFTNGTILVHDVSAFTNDGGEAATRPILTFIDGTDLHGIDPTTGASIATGPEENGNIGVYDMVTVTDPLTKKTRLIVGNTLGVYSVLDRGNGAANGKAELHSIGDTTDPSSLSGDVQFPTTSRNGNLQIAQFYAGAAQPSIAAAEVAADIRGSGGLLYGNAKDNGFPVSDPHVLDNGNIFWSGPTGTGTGITTDQTGTGNAYSFQWPSAGILSAIATTDFFVVNTNGHGFQTATGLSGTGLVQTGSGGTFTPDPQWPFLANVSITPPAGPVEFSTLRDLPIANPVVNPLDGQDAVISSAAGRVFYTLNASSTPTGWAVLADPSQLDGSYAPALAYGAPDSNGAIANLGAAPDFVYAGTEKGNVFVTLDRGNTWANLTTLGNFAAISNGDTSPVMQIVADPVGGSHDFFMVTMKGVYRASFNVTYSRGDNPPPAVSNVQWQNLTMGLFSIRETFGQSTAGPSNVHNSLLVVMPDDPKQAPLTSTREETPLDYLTSLAVDWRQVTGTNRAAAPTLYVGGSSGVYRLPAVASGSPAPSWAVYPSVQNDSALVDGGYLPNVPVRSLSLSTGAAPGGALNQATGPNVLVATTFGRGAFAIRLQNNDQFNPVQGPVAEGLSDTPTDSPTTNGTVLAFGSTFVDVVFTNAVDAASFKPGSVVITGPNGNVPVTSVQDMTPVTAGQPSKHNVIQINFAAQNTAGTYNVMVGPNVTDFAGHTMDQDQELAQGQPFDDGGGPGVDDAFFGSFTISAVNPNGLHVNNAAADNLTSPPGMSSITVTFNKAVDPTTFHTTDVTLTDPSSNNVTITSLTHDASQTVWTIGFATQKATGTYFLTLSNTIKDTSGNFIDQNGDDNSQASPPTREPADQFMASFAVSAPSSGGGGPGPSSNPAPLTGPIPAGLLNIVAGPIVPVRDRHHHIIKGKFMQLVQVFNIGNQPIAGPIALVVDGLNVPPRRHHHRPRMTNLLGQTAIGSPFQLTFAGLDPFALQGAVFVLNYSADRAADINPTFRVVSGIPLV